jgi:TIR domain
MPVKVFFCYAHEDELLLNKLKAHLRPLQRQGLIHVWHDRDISAGTEWEREISKHLNEADIILLLVSPDFMNSDYCYSIEMQQAIERHERGEVCAIPVILRAVSWQGVLGKLQALPTDAKPVISASWHNIDEALLDVAEGIRKVVEEVTTKPSISPPIKEFESETEHASQIVQLQRDPVASQFIQHISGNAQVGIAGVNYGQVTIHQTAYQRNQSQHQLKVTLGTALLTLGLPPNMQLDRVPTLAVYVLNVGTAASYIHSVEFESIADGRTQVNSFVDFGRGRASDMSDKFGEALQPGQKHTYYYHYLDLSELGSLGRNVIPTAVIVYDEIRNEYREPIPEHVAKEIISHYRPR